MKTKCFISALAMLTVLSICSCQLLFQPSGELYISVDGIYGTVTCELYLVSYLTIGNDASSGKNILSKKIRTDTISGRQWMVFEIPKGQWDIYLEYYTHGAFDSWNNDRRTVNLTDNDWVALWLPANDWTSARRFAGSGPVSVPL
jgi:hypothetical protein